MSDTTKTGESRQVLQKCIRDLLAQLKRERKFRAAFELQMGHEVAKVRSVRKRSTLKWMAGWEAGILSLREDYYMLKAQHIVDNEKESESG